MKDMGQKGNFTFAEIRFSKVFQLVKCKVENNIFIHKMHLI